MRVTYIRQRQGVKPKVLVGLDSSSSMETLQGCAKQAQGMIIPTSFAPVTASTTLLSACWRRPHHADFAPLIGDHRTPAPEALPEEVQAAIAGDFPEWRPADGLCSRCADLYASRVAMCVNSVCRVT